MVLACVPSIDPAEDALTRCERVEMLFDEWPCPISDAHDTVTGPRLRPAGAELPALTIDVGFDEGKDRTDLDTSAVRERKDGTVGQDGAFDELLHVGQLEEEAAGFCGRWWGYVTHWARREDTSR